MAISDYTFPEFALCPYCEHKISPHPKRTRLCPNCNNRFYVKRRPGEVDYFLVTEEVADEIEKQWQTSQQDKEMASAIERLNIPKEQCYSTTNDDEPNCNKQFNFDSIVSLTKSRLDVEKDPQERKRIYSELAGICDKYRLNSEEYQVGMLREELLSLKSAGFNYAKIDVLKQNACGNCDRKDGKIVFIDAELRERTFPPKNCACKSPSDIPGWCYGSFTVPDEFELKPGQRLFNRNVESSFEEAKRVHSDRDSNLGWSAGYGSLDIDGSERKRNEVIGTYVVFGILALVLILMVISC